MLSNYNEGDLILYYVDEDIKFFYSKGVNLHK